ncbi:MAG: sodium:proton antiporter NhaD, partial [Acidiferrobacterales bacterium]
MKIIALAITGALTISSLFIPELALGSESTVGEAGGKTLDLTQTAVGYWAIAIFVLAYALVMAEEFTHLRKSKPVIIAAGLIWGMIGYVYSANGLTHEAENAVRHNLLEYAELMLFLLVAMTYINAMQ